MPIELKRIIEQNPFNDEINSITNSVNNCLINVESKASDIVTYRDALENSKIQKKVYETKLSVLKKQLSALEKVASQASTEFNCDFLKPERLEKFFASIGMKFLNITFRSNYNEGVLRFIRPARMIGCLPVQPMILAIKYKNNNDVLMLYNVFCEYALDTSYSYNVHPHVGSGFAGSVCLGNYNDILEEQSVPLVMEAYQDHVILLDQLLSTYNPDSPFRRIDEILVDFVKKELRFTDMQLSVIGDTSGVAILHSKLSTTRYVYNIRDLITRTLYEEYYEMMSHVKYKDIIEDIEAWVQMFSYENDSSECYDYACSLHSTLIHVFEEFSFEDPHDFAESDDDDSYRLYRLYESGMDELKKVWIKKLNEIRETEGFNDATIQFKGLQPLNEVFP